MTLGGGVGPLGDGVWPPDAGGGVPLVAELAGEETPVCEGGLNSVEEFVGGGSEAISA